jgi:D-alanine-D-alanine ligase
MSKHIVVLLGGMSAERDVSLSSGTACAKALRELGYQVTELDMQPDIVEKIKALKPDCVFNALHGRYGEDGCVQGVLEILGIPYTHSGVLASSIAMDKPMAKKIFRAAGIRTPEGGVVSRADFSQGDPLPRPYVLKPVNEGSSVGVFIIKAGGNLNLDAVFSEHEMMLAEPFVAGRELAVAVLNDKALGVVELRSSKEFYDYEAKYTNGVTTHHMPAPIHEKAYKEACDMALKAHQALGCRGLTRSDFRYDDTQGEPGALFLLEVNTQPGMTPLSLSPEIAQHAGIDFKMLVNMLIQEAFNHFNAGSTDNHDGKTSHRARA